MGYQPSTSESDSGFYYMSLYLKDAYKITLAMATMVYLSVYYMHLYLKVAHKNTIAMMYLNFYYMSLYLKVAQKNTIAMVYLSDQTLVEVHDLVMAVEETSGKGKQKEEVLDAGMVAAV